MGLTGYGLSTYWSASQTEKVFWFIASKEFLSIFPKAFLYLVLKKKNNTPHLSRKIILPLTCCRETVPQRMKKMEKQHVSHPTDLVTVNFCALPKQASSKREDTGERFNKATVISAFRNMYDDVGSINNCTGAMLQTPVLFVWYCGWKYNPPLLSNSCEKLCYQTLGVHNCKFHSEVNFKLH